MNRHAEPRGTAPHAHERGMAMVLAMLVLLVLSLLVVVMISTLSVNRQVTGQSASARKALDNAEAGVAEAIMRLRNGDASMSQANPRSTAQIFLAPAGSIPVVGTDTTAMGTAQPAGSWLTYSSATKSPDVLTIAYKTDPGRTTIYRYDATRNPAVNTATGLPIYEITSTGRAGNFRRTIVTDVIAKPVIANTKGALAANIGINFIGTAQVCGYNHSGSTPVHTGDNGRGSSPDCVPYETGSGDLVAAWSTGSITGGGASLTTGYPVNNLGGQTGFYAGPWEMLGMTQPDFVSFMGAPTTSPGSLNGIICIDNNATLGDQSASAAFHSTNGEGMLYVDGDLTVNAGFNYVGLVYVEGDFRINGQAWILGAVVVRGNTTAVRMTGGATILYSSDAVTQKLAQYGSLYTTLSWREK